MFFFTVTLADRRASMLTDHIELLRAAYGADFSTRWSRIKSAFSRGLPAAMGRSPSKLAKREKGIWQRRFWEHQIRDEIDLQRHVD